MSELKVPFAIDSNDRLHSPDEAKKGINYFCPNCHDPLVFRNGEIKIPHFAHKTSLTCSNESIEHKTAKLLVLNAINDHLRKNGEKPKFLKHCGNCYKLYDIPLPSDSSIAVLEYKLPCGYIGDVVVLSNNNTPLLVIEIRIAHAVDSKKHNAISTSYIELDGYKVIDNRNGIPIIKSKIESVYCCYSCEIERKRINRDNKFKADKAWLIEKSRNNNLPTTRNQQGNISLIDLARALANAESEELSDSDANEIIEAINNDFANWKQTVNTIINKPKSGKTEQPKVIKQQIAMF